MASSPPVKSAKPLIGPALVPLAHHQGKPPIQLIRPVSVIGSRSNARIHLISSTVSKAHALLVRSNGRSYVRDLASRTKVYVNDVEIREAELNDGDLLRIGSFEFRYIAAPGEGKPRRKTPLPLAMPAKLEVAGEPLPVPLEERVTLIGRRSLCDIHLLEESVSTAHAVIFEMNGQRFIRDLGSRTGTFVNGVSTHQHQLSPGDTIRVGDTEMRFRPAEAAAEQPADLATIDVDLDAHHDQIVPGFEPVAAEPETAPVAPPPLDILDAFAEPRAAVAEPVAPVESAEPVEAIAPEPPQVPLAEPVNEPPAPPISDESAAPLLLADITEAPAPPAAPEQAAIEPADLQPTTETQAQPAPESAEELIAGPTQTDEQEADLLPRRGWRGSSSEGVSRDLPELQAPEQPSEPEPAMEFAQPASEPAPVADEAPPTDRGISFPDSISSEEPAAPAIETIDLPAESSETEQAPPPAMLDQESLQAEPFEASVAPDEAAIEEPAEPQLQQPASEPIDLIAASEPPTPPQPMPEEPAQPSSLDLATLDISAHVEEPPQETREEPLLIEPAAEDASEPQTIEPAAELAASAPEPIIDLTAPAPAEAEVDAEPEPGLAQAPPPQETKAPVESTPEALLPPQTRDQPEPASGRRSRKSRRRRKQEQPAPTAAPEELIERTEPTPQSALQSAADELALDSSGGAETAAPQPPIVDELTDTKFDRAVREFAGHEIGEIVEPAPEPGGQQTPPAPEAPTAATTETPAGAQAIAPPPWGANQDNVLRGQPLQFTPVAQPGPISQAPIPPDHRAVEDLIAEIDNVAAAAEQAASTVSAAAPDQTQDDQLPPVIPALPARARPRKGPNVFRSGRKRRDETIPPYNGEPPAGQLTTGFDGLAMPPVREMDVFSQMSPPATDETPINLGTPDADEISAIAESISSVERPAEPFDLPPSSQASADAEDSPTTTVPRRRGRARQSSEAFAAAIPNAFTPVEPIEPVDRAFAQPLADEEPDLIGTRRQRVRPALSPFEADFSGSGVPATGGRRPPITYVAEQTEAEAAAIRRKYFRRVAVMLGAMAVLIALSVMAIQTLVGVNSTVEAGMTFKNVAALTLADRNIFQADQKQRLKQETTRHRAKQLLNERDPAIPPGFLDDPLAYFNVADRAFFTDQRPDVLTLRVIGKYPEQDKARVLAMAGALFEADKSYTDQAERARGSLDDLKNQIKQYQRQMDDLNSQITKLRLQGESRPTPEKLNKLEADVNQLESKWNDAVVAVKTAEAELARMKSAPAGDAAPASDNPGESASQQDPKIKSLQTQLDGLMAKVNATRSANAEQAADAKKGLDAALDAFQKQLADAQGMMNGNPQLTAYVQAAQKLQETTRQLTDELIRRQEQQFARLTELKDRLNEKMEQLRVKSWESDSQLKELNERLDMLTRQHNAAVGGGLQKEADDLQSQIDLTKNMIKARQDLLPGDNLYADVIKQLQVVIDSTKQNIEEDRKKTETLLTSLQQSFTSSQSIEKLPQEQKQLAASLQQQLKQINDARAQYNSAIDTTAADADSQLKTQITSLQAQIDARRRDLADQNLKDLQSRQEHDRLAAIDAKNAELAKLKQAEAEAQQAYFAKDKELREARTALADAKTNAENLDGLIRQKSRVESGLRADNQQIENKKNAVDRAVEPTQTTDSDVAIHRGEDWRMIYSAVSVGGILAVFMVMILWTLHTASNEAPGVSISGSIAGADSTSAPPASPPVSDSPAGPPTDPAGHAPSSNGNAHGTQEDHEEPAVA